MDAALTLSVMVQRGRPQPPSWQLAALLRDQIKSGELPSGSALPPIVTLASEHGVTTNTVQKALRMLKAEGLVTSVPGYGTFVAEK
jgi:DNA-binding GntR family transcriptional regulator